MSEKQPNDTKEPDATDALRAPCHTPRDANALKDDSADTEAASAPPTKPSPTQSVSKEIEAAELLFAVTFASLKDGISQGEYIDLA